MTKERFSGRSIADALAMACQHFGLSEGEIDYHVVQEPSRGFLGFSKKPAKIDAWPKKAGQEADFQADEAANVLEKALLDAPIFHDEDVVDDLLITENQESRDAESLGLAFLGPVFEGLKVNPVVTVSQEEDAIRFDVSGEDVGILIGRRGDNLYDLQFLLSLAINRHIDNHLRVILDVENYQDRRMETLENLAARLAEQARSQRRTLRLEPMRANERRILHLALEKEEGITSKSEGKEPYRRVVVLPEYKDNF